ncbi:MAG: thioredoxin-like domain-containing protein [Verrucomicrobia bacterium]|nr:thioredoxin-like domain-containing protein [Verrucomicrobiota bacterium]
MRYPAYPSLRTLVCLLAGLTLGSPAFAKLETWSSFDGAKIQAEFVSRKGDYVIFKSADGSRLMHPYAKLNEADRTRVDAFAAPLADDPAPPTQNAASPAASAPAPAVKSGAVLSALDGKLVAVKGKALAPISAAQIGSVRYLAVYYSAHWCPPCRGFTPRLVAAYQEIKARHPEFELIFVSSDQNASAMQGYMSEYKMAWPAVRFDQRNSATILRRPGHESGIPNLVFMRADGKELSLSYKPNGDYRGPDNVLADIRKELKM